MEANACSDRFLMRFFSSHSYWTLPCSRGKTQPEVLGGSREVLRRFYREVLGGSIEVLGKLDSVVEITR